MELVYLWVDQSNNISGQGFNFSSKYQCTNDDYMLTIIDKSKSKNEDNLHIHNLFSDNLYINTIIGENGSGKSSILDYLSNGDNFGASFYVYEEDDKLYIRGDKHGIVTSNKELKLSKRHVSIEKIDINNKSIDEKSYGFSDDFNTKIIKVLGKKDDVLKYFDNRFIFDKLLITNTRSTLISGDSLVDNQYNKLLNNLHKKILNLIQNYIIKSKDNISKYKDITRFSTNNISLDIKISFLINYMSLFNEILNDDFINTPAKREFILSNKNYFDELTFENMFELIRKFTNQWNELKMHDRNILESIKAYENLIKYLSKFDEGEFFQRNEHSHELSKQFDIKKEIEEINYIIGECENCYSQYSEFKCLEFNFYSYDGYVILSELSTGEQNLIYKYFTIIYQVLFSHLDILLIDEPDTYLHPKWAKCFLNNLINIITKDEILKNKKLHLIITTHSPFILSDLPKENVLFLENGEQKYPFKDKQTFGANIHTLLSDGFFMSDGLMGEFAKSKIIEVIELLKKDTLESTDIKMCQNIISIIGEPLLKNTLQQQLDLKLNPHETELEKLERERIELTAKINSIIERESSETN